MRMNNIYREIELGLYSIDEKNGSKMSIYEEKNRNKSYILLRKQHFCFQKTYNKNIKGLRSGVFIKLFLKVKHNLLQNTFKF